CFAGSCAWSVIGVLVIGRDAQSTRFARELLRDAGRAALRGRKPGSARTSPSSSALRGREPKHAGDLVRLRAGLGLRDAGVATPARRAAAVPHQEAATDLPWPR